MKPPSSFYRAVCLMLGASLLFSGMGALVKVATETLPFMEAVFFRASVSVVLITPWMLKKKIPFLGTHRPLLLLRSAAGFVALVSIFYATAHLRLSDAAILNQTSPIFVALLSGLFLKELLHRRIFMYSAIALIGAALIIKPTGRFFNIAGLIGIGSGFFAAVAYVSIKHLHQTDRPETMVFGFAAFSTLASLVFAHTFKWPTPVQWLALIAMGILATFAQVMLTQAYHAAPASRVAPFSYSSVIFSACWGVLGWGEWPDFLSAIGTLLILSAGIGLMRGNRAPTSDSVQTPDLDGRSGDQTIEVRHGHPLPEPNAA